MSDDDAELPRETGAEKAGRNCPVCNGAMQVSESAYGSIVAVCPKCSAPKVETQTASHSTPPTPNFLQRLTGTNTSDDKEQTDGGR